MMNRLFIAVLSFLMLVACGSTPVKDLRPEVDYSESNIGRGRSVYLEVNEIPLGIQESLLKSGIVDNNFSLPLIIKRDVRAGLFNFGFSTGHSPEDSEIGLAVNLIDMAYLPTDDKVLSGLYLRYEFSLVLTKASTIHTFTYATQRTHKLALAPNVEKGRELIGEIMAETLQRAFKDPAFVAELSTD
jgi:hypothetical protein